MTHGHFGCQIMLPQDNKSHKSIASPLSLPCAVKPRLHRRFGRLFKSYESTLPCAVKPIVKRLQRCFRRNFTFQGTKTFQKTWFLDAISGSKDAKIPKAITSFGIRSQAPEKNMALRLTKWQWQNTTGNGFKVQG